MDGWVADEVDGKMDGRKNKNNEIKKWKMTMKKWMNEFER